MVLKTSAGLVVVATAAGAFLELHPGMTFAANSPKPKPSPTPTPPVSGSNAALQWNTMALQAVRDVSPGPTITSRALAIMHTCMYDAWAAYDPNANPTRPNGIPRQKGVKDATEAVSYAAYRALMDIFPTDVALYTGQQITAWGGYGKGTLTFDGGQWFPYQEAIVVTPPFPEYVSGHSTFSAAGAYILQQATGSDTFGNSFTAAPGSSQIEPGFAPSQSVTLSWPTFSAAAAEAGISRQYGGIHFNQADQDGRARGKQVATQVWTRAIGYISGSIKPGS